MLQLKSLSKLGLGLSIPVVLAESKEKAKQETKPSRLVKPSQLPIYDEPQDRYSYEYQGNEKGKLEEGISVVRKELESAYSTTKDTRDTVWNVYETGKAHSLASIDYVLEEENVAAKVGVITLGGLLGLTVLGRKKGILKKLFYTSAAVTGATALVYPKEASKIYEDVYNNSGDYAAIAYNFVAGVKPQSEAKVSSPPSEPPKKASPAPPATPPSEVSPAPFPTSPAPFQTLLRQADDVMLWGFRLFDPKEVSKSPLEGFGSLPDQTGSTLKPEVRTRNDVTKDTSSTITSTSQSTAPSTTKSILPTTILSPPPPPTSPPPPDPLQGLPPDQFPLEIFLRLVKDDPSYEDRLEHDRRLLSKLEEEQMLKRIFLPEEEEGKVSSSKVGVLVKDVAEVAASAVVEEVAEEVKKEAEGLSREARGVAEASLKVKLAVGMVEAVAEAVEETADEGASSAVEREASVVAEVSRAVEQVVSEVEVVAAESEEVADAVSGAAQVVSEGAEEIVEGKEREVEKMVKEMVQGEADGSLESSRRESVAVETKETKEGESTARSLVEKETEKAEDGESTLLGPVDIKTMETEEGDSNGRDPVAMETKEKEEKAASGRDPVVMETKETEDGNSIGHDSVAMETREREEDVDSAPNEESASESLSFVKLPSAASIKPSDPIGDFTDVMIESMLNIKVIGVEPPLAGDQGGNDADAAEESEGAPSDQDTDGAEPPIPPKKGFFSSLKESLKEKLERTRPKPEEEEEERDIDAMNEKFSTKDSAAEITVRFTEDDLRFVEAPGYVSVVPGDVDQARKVTSQSGSAAKDLVVKMVAKAPKAPVQGDIGQSNPEDKDMYTTRG